MFFQTARESNFSLGVLRLPSVRFRRRPLGLRRRSNRSSPIEKLESALFQTVSKWPSLISFGRKTASVTMSYWHFFTCNFAMYVYFCCTFSPSAGRPSAHSSSPSEARYSWSCVHVPCVSVLYSSSGSHQHLSKTTLFTIELVKITTNDGIRAGHR